MDAFELIKGFFPFLFIIRSLKYFPLTIRLEQNSGALAEIIWLGASYHAVRSLIMERQT